MYIIFLSPFSKGGWRGIFRTGDLLQIKFKELSRRELWGGYGTACNHKISPHPSLPKRGKSKNDPLDCMEAL
jgi:hypothetical protein